MRIKIKLINLSLIFATIYSTFFAYSFFEYFFISGTRRVENERFVKIDFPQKIDAVNRGYRPLIYPNSIIREMIKNKKIKFYPVAGKSFQLTYLIDEGYGLIKYKSDRFGFRNNDNNWNKIYKNKNIFLVGDSFINGFSVPEKYNLNSLIEDSININTLSLGMASNTPYEYMAVLKSIVEPITKKSKNENKVILFFYYNDNILADKIKDDLTNKSASIIDETYLEEVIPRKEYTKTIDKFIENHSYSNQQIKLILWKEAIKASTVYRLFTLQPIRSKIYKIKSILNSEDKSTHISNNLNIENPTKKSIKTLSEICKNYCEPIVVLIPNSNYWRPDPEYYKYKILLKETAKDLNITFIDGEDVIDKDNLDDYAPKGSHLSLNGNKKLSDLIIIKLQKENL